MNETVYDVVSSSRSVRDSREVAASWANGHIKRAADGLEDVGKLAVIISRPTAVQARRPVSLGFEHVSRQGNTCRRGAPASPWAARPTADQPGFAPVLGRRRSHILKADHFLDQTA